MTHHLLRVRPTMRTDVLVDLAAATGRTLIFTRTKSRARSLTRQLNQRGVAAVELHGNLSQNARTRSMEAFHAGRVSTLVATDIAARGIHVDDIELVVHADPPAEAKAYVHRSGRTARAGKSGHRGHAGHRRPGRRRQRAGPRRRDPTDRDRRERHQPPGASRHRSR